MSNHSIDCEFCGRDQRLVYDGPCCEAYVESQKKKHKEIEASCKRAEAHVKSYGIDWRVDHRETSMVLRHLERRYGLTASAKDLKRIWQYGSMARHHKAKNGDKP